MLRIYSDSRARAEVDEVAFDRECLRQDVGDFSRGDFCAVECLHWQKNRKLVAAQTCREIGVAQVRAYHVAELAQHRVSGQM